MMNGQYLERYWIGTRSASLREGNIRFALSEMVKNDTYLGYYVISGDTVLDSLTGGEDKNSHLRPIVSINLSDSKCTMTQEKEDDGTIKYILNFS